MAAAWKPRCPAVRRQITPPLSRLADYSSCIMEAKSEAGGDL